MLYFDQSIRRRRFPFALSQIHPIKAPGPDGMCPLFFQSYWNVVGLAVTNSVIKILNGESMPTYLSKTFIALIPKKVRMII